MDDVNDLFPRFNEHNDVYSERIKSICLFVCSFSVLMMVTSPIGWLYSCFPRPFYTFIFYLHRIPIREPPQPEWGIHYITLFIYMLCAYVGMVFFEHQKIDKPFHKIVYVSCLTILSFFIPFELIYITLYDIFHSIPKYGNPLIWFGGSSNSFNILNSVIIQDILLPLFCIIIMYLIKNDLDDSIKTNISLNRKSVVLFSLYVVFMVSWILMPIWDDSLPVWGTNYFPQTIYFEYGNVTQIALEHNVTLPYENELDFGIINEYWFPNDIIKYHNHISKMFSVFFMFYTFLPRRKKRINPRISQSPLKS